MINKNVIDDTNDVCSHLSDEESKKIYVNRLLYSLTGDLQYIRKQIASCTMGQDFIVKYNDFLDRYPQSVIFGAGVWGTIPKDLAY